MFKLIFFDCWKDIFFIWQPIFFFLAFFIYFWHSKSFPTCLWEGNKSLANQGLRYKNTVSHLFCTRPLPVWQKDLDVFRGLCFDMPGAIEKRTVIYDAWKILNIYCNKERGEKERVMFILHGFSNNNTMVALTNTLCSLISRSISGRWEQMGLLAFSTMTTEKHTCYYNQKLTNPLKEKISRLVAEKLCSFKISWNQVIQKPIFKRHELQGKMERVVGLFWHLAQWSWSFLNVNMSNKENNSAILQDVMCHLLTKPIPKK